MSFTRTVYVGKVVASVPTGSLEEEKVRGNVTLLKKDYSQPRVEAVCHRTAWAGECGLGGRMVLLMEFEGDGVTRLSGDGVGLECEDTSATHDDTVVSAGGGRRGARSD